MTKQLACCQLSWKNKYKFSKNETFSTALLRHLLKRETEKLEYAEITPKEITASTKEAEKRNKNNNMGQSVKQEKFVVKLTNCSQNTPNLNG